MIIFLGCVFASLLLTTIATLCQKGSLMRGVALCAVFVIMTVGMYNAWPGFIPIDDSLRRK